MKNQTNFKPSHLGSFLLILTFVLAGHVIFLAPAMAQQRISFEAWRTYGSQEAIQLDSVFGPLFPYYVTTTHPKNTIRGFLKGRSPKQNSNSLWLELVLNTPITSVGDYAIFGRMWTDSTGETGTGTLSVTNYDINLKSFSGNFALRDMSKTDSFMFLRSGAITYVPPKAAMQFYYYQSGNLGDQVLDTIKMDQGDSMWLACVVGIKGDTIPYGFLNESLIPTDIDIINRLESPDQVFKKFGPTGTSKRSDSILILATTKPLQDSVYRLTFKANANLLRESDTIVRYVNVRKKFYTYNCNGLPLIMFDASFCDGRQSTTDGGLTFVKSSYGWKAAGAGMIAARGLIVVNNFLKFEGDMRLDTLHGSIETTGNWYLDTIPLPLGLSTGRFDLRGDPVSLNINCTGLTFGARKALNAYVSSMLGGFQFRLDSLAFIPGSDGLHAIGVRVGVSLIFPAEKLKNGGLFDGDCGGSVFLGTKDKGMISLQPLEITKTGINFSLHVKDIPFAKTFCLKDAFISYYREPDSFDIGAKLKTPFLSKKGATFEENMGWKHGIWDAAGFKVNLGQSIPIADTPLGFKSGNGSIKGMQDPPLDLSFGGTVNLFAQPNLFECDMNVKYVETPSLEGSVVARLFNVVIWQIECAGKCVLDWHNYISMSGTFKAGNLGGTAYVLNGNGVIKDTWRPLFAQDGKARGTINIPNLPGNTEWGDWANNVLGLPITLGQGDAVLHNGVLRANLDYLFLGYFPIKLHIAVDMTKSYGVPGFIDIGKGNIRLSQAKKKGGSTILENRTKTITVAPNTEQVLIRIASSSKVSTSSLITPSGQTITKSTDTLVLYSESKDNTKSFWLLHLPAAGKWILNIPNAQTTDTIDASAILKERDFSISAVQAGKQVTITWDTVGTPSDGTVDFYLDAKDSGFDGLRIGSANGRDGSFTYLLDDTLPGCFFYAYGLRDESGGISRAYASKLLVNDKTGIPLAMNIKIVPGTVGKLLVTWSNPADSNAAAGYLVRVTDAKGYDSTYPSVSPLLNSREIDTAGLLRPSVSVQGFNSDGLTGCWTPASPLTPASVIPQRDPLTAHTILLGNHPNPTNSTTTIDYELDSRVGVRLDIFSLLGNHIQTIENGIQEAGVYHATVNLSGLAPGTYYYRIQAGNSIETKKLILR